LLDSASPDEDSESVSSSVDCSSVASEDVGGFGGANGRDEAVRGEEDVEFYLTSQIDQLTEKK